MEKLIAKNALFIMSRNPQKLPTTVTMTDHVPATDDLAKRFTKNIETHRTGLVRFVCSRGYTPADAEDVVQKATVNIWRKYAEYTEGTSFTTWAIAITHNELCNDIRSSKRVKRKTLVQDQHLYESALGTILAPETETSEKIEKLEGLLSHMPQDKVNLLCSVYIDGEPIDELAKANGKSPRTYYNILNTIKKQLIEDMQK